MENMVEEVEENGTYWTSVPLTELAKEQIVYAGTTPTPQMEVEVTTVSHEPESEIPEATPIGAQEEKGEEKPEPKKENGQTATKADRKAKKPEKTVSFPMARADMYIEYRKLKEILDLTNTLVTEAKLKLTKDGIDYTCVDPGHVAMLSGTIPKESFSGFQCEEEGEWTVDIEHLKKSLPKVKSEDLVHLSSDRERIAIDAGPFHKEITSLDPSSVVTPRIPQIVSDDYHVVMGQFEAREAFKGAESVSDAIRLTLTENGLEFKAMNDSENYEANFEKDWLKELKVDRRAPMVKSSYPLDYLLKLFKAMKTVEEVDFSFKDDYPMTLKFSTKAGSFIFLLAPRMEQ